MNIFLNKNYRTKFYLKDGRVINDDFDDLMICKDISRVNFNGNREITDYYTIIKRGHDCIYDSRDYEETQCHSQ